MKKAVILVTMGLTSTTAFADQTSDTVKMQTPKKPKKHLVATTQNATTTPPAAKDESAKSDSDKADDKKYAFMDNFSGQYMLTTNYVFRGISQTRDLPAVQGGITYTLPLGIYLNVWASNVKFKGNRADIEIDTIAGVRGDVVKDVLKYDINVDRYNYPGMHGILDYNELNTLFNFYFIQVGVSYSGNEYNSHTTGTYFNGGINTDIPPNYFFGVDGMSVQILYGHFNLSCKAGCTYSDYNIALNKKIKNYTLTLQWTDTNGGQHMPPIDQSQIIGSVNVDF